MSSVSDQATMPGVRLALALAPPSMLTAVCSLHYDVTPARCPCVNHPVVLYFRRLWSRTLLRMCRLAELCKPCCEASPREVFFSREWQHRYYHLAVHCTMS